MELPPWLIERLACPRDGKPLVQDNDAYECAAGHRYRIRHGVPILLRDDVEQTHEAALHSLRGPDEPEPPPDTNGIDRYVQEAIGATGGYLYGNLVGQLTDYPIPELRLPPGGGRTFLDIGCNWGRWSIAAARCGYRVVGIDPSLVGIRSARRVARQLGIDASFIVGDARYLPFANNSFDTVFSYSVVQHLSKEDAQQTFTEIGRVLVAGGRSLIQLPNAFGMRSMYQQLRRRLRPPKLFEVRYWSIPEMRRMSTSHLGPSKIFVDGFFSLNAQVSDLRFLSPSGKIVVNVSEALRALSHRVPLMMYAADSVYIESTKEVS